MLTKHEEMALLDVLSKRIKERLDELKGESKQELAELNQEHGVDRQAIMIGGKKCGTVSVTYSKPKVAIKPEHMGDAIAYLEEAKLTEMQPIKGWEDSFVFEPSSGSIFCTATGEDVGDLFYYQPEYPKGAMVRVKQDDAVEALRPLIQDIPLEELLLSNQKQLGGEVSD